jgi:branched-chain amino acid transport system ATP-binding protein
MADLLAVDGVVAGYGDSVVLEDVSFTLEEGGSLALLGRNGMGKTTLLLTLMGITRLRRGRVSWRGTDLTIVPTHLRAQAGLGWVPQERCVFPSLTVEEHLEVVARPGEWTLQRVYQLFPRLAQRRDHLGNQLSGGEQQMLAIGRALMCNPLVLLMDEPLEGLAPVIVDALLAGLDRLKREDDLALLVVEQHARIALQFAENAVILDRGLIVHSGPSRELLDAPERLAELIGVGRH